jgi:ribA/ribD-fused uncharacterized protein
MTIDKFAGKYYFLSNYYTCPVEWEGILYPSSEHAYHASKTLDENIRKKFAECKTPGDSKKLSRKIKVRENFHQEKVSFMKEIVRIKFEMNSDLKKKLLDTKNQQLIEGNTWGKIFNSTIISLLIR